MQQQFAMPDVGEGLTEAEIVGWRVAVGDTVTLNQTLVEVETAKAVVELPSPYAGVITALHYAAGDVVAVGADIITIEDGVDVAQPPAQTAPAQTAPAREAVLVGYGVSHAAVVRRARKPGWVPPADSWTLEPSAGGQPYAKPPVRQLARRLGVDLSLIAPTGAQGEVTRDDVTSAATRPAGPSSPPAETRVAVKGVRKHIAEAMVKSAFTAPHVTEWVSVDVTRSLKLIERLKNDRAWAGVRITPLTLLARAVAIAVSHRPEINARWDSDSNEIVQYRDLNLGIAVASPRGLIVPNIAAAQNLSFRELAVAMADLVETARANRTSPERMQGGTFTLTNVGVFGVDGATPILNPGESAILAFGRTRELPWNHKGKIRLRSVSTLSLSFDHRLVDGKLGSSVLADIAGLMERPALALIA